MARAQGAGCGNVRWWLGGGAAVLTIMAQGGVQGGVGGVHIIASQHCARKRGLVVVLVVVIGVQQCCPAWHARKQGVCAAKPTGGAFMCHCAVCGYKPRGLLS
jgi:hypothetical protein